MKVRVTVKGDYPKWLRVEREVMVEKGAKVYLPYLYISTYDGEKTVEFFIDNDGRIYCSRCDSPVCLMCLVENEVYLDKEFKKLVNHAIKHLRGKQ